MKKATSYDEWRDLEIERDRETGAEDWRLRDEDHNYSAARVRERHKMLQRHRDAGNVREMLFFLNEGIHGNQDGIGRTALYKTSLVGTKKLIEEYIDLICESLNLIAEANSGEVPFDEKLDFFRRASRCFGSSALALSGAGGMLYFHHGVVHSLIESDLLPNVVSGSSGGAWLCSQLGTLTDDELRSHFIDHSYNIPAYGTPKLTLSNLREFFGKNITERSRTKDDIVDQFVNSEITFQEAFEKTGRYINISVAPSERHQNSRLMNAITSPNVTIASAAKASGALPGLFEPVQLYAKNHNGRVIKYLPGQRWLDGSVSDDLPFKKIARLYGVNHFIVSLANPVVLPFIYPESKQEVSSLWASYRNIATCTAKEAMKVLRSNIPAKENGAISNLLMLCQEVINQQYHGDINVFMSVKHIRARRFFFAYKTNDEIQSLIRAGQIAAWEKQAQIKTSSAISRTLRVIMQELDRESLEGGHSQHKPHMII